MRYYALYTFVGQKRVHVMHGKNDQVVVEMAFNAPEVLEQMCVKLQKENIIDNFRIVQEI